MNDDTDVIDDVQAEKDFASGFPGDEAPAKPATEAKEKAEAKTEEPPQQSQAKPKYARFTEEEAAELRSLKAWAQQGLDKAWGSAGNAHKLINEVKAAIEEIRASVPRGVKLKADAFAGMAKDFPELAEHIRQSIEGGLEGVTGTGPANARIDPEEVTRLVDARARQIANERELDDLEDAYPNWKTVVGAIAAGETPDPNNPFRKWLGTKDKAYQDKINGTHSGLILQRAIRTFQRETRMATPTAPARPNQRTEQLRAAIQPQGDGGRVPTRVEEDDFESGFRTG